MSVIGFLLKLNTTGGYTVQIFCIISDAACR